MNSSEANKARRVYRRKRREKGLCIDCSKSADGSKARCPVHLADRAGYVRRRMPELRKKYKGEGRCQACSSPLDEDMDAGRIQCLHCREKRGLGLRE